MQIEKKTAFSVGIFILAGLFILILAMSWLQEELLKPSYHFNVVFKKLDRLSKDSPVYYRGIEIGRVENIEFTSDFQSTIIRIRCIKTKLRMPKNVDVSLRIGSLGGQRYVDIMPAKSGKATGIVNNGDLLIGRDSTTLENLEDQLSRIAENKSLEKILASSQRTMQNLMLTSTEIRGLAKSSKQSLKKMSGHFSLLSVRVGQAANHVGNLAYSVKQPVQQAIPQVVDVAHQFSQRTQGLGDTLSSIKTTSDTMQKTFGHIDTQLTETKLIPNLATTVTQVQGGAQALNRFLGAEGVSELSSLAEMFNELQQRGQSMEFSISVVKKQYPNLSDAKLNQFLVQVNNFSRDLQGKSKIFEMLIVQANDGPTLKNNLNVISSDADSIIKTSDQLEIFYQSRLKPVELENTTPWETISGDLVKVHQVGEKTKAISAALRPQADKVILLKQNVQPTFTSTLKEYNCTAQQVNYILGRRFLGLKLLFGQPAKGFKCN